MPLPSMPHSTTLKQHHEPHLTHLAQQPPPTHPLPTNLPIPKDDNACAHLTNLTLPSLSLPTTSGAPLPLSSLTSLTLFFIYPRTAAPTETVPDEWNAIPGARGCTPQLCSVRDTLSSLHALGIPAEQIYGLSTQSTDVQKEVVERLHLPYRLLSDEGCEFVDALKLPTFEWEGKRAAKRVTLAIEEGRVVKWWYPVFPPDRGVEDVVAWLKVRESDKGAEICL